MLGQERAQALPLQSLGRCSPTTHCTASAVSCIASLHDTLIFRKHFSLSLFLFRVVPYTAVCCTILHCTIYPRRSLISLLSLCASAWTEEDGRDDLICADQKLNGMRVRAQMTW